MGLSDMNITAEVKGLLSEILQLGERADSLTAETPLLGALPELDSMAVATVIAGIEDRFDVIVEDDELSAETFSTVGSLVAFVEQKLSQ